MLITRFARSSMYGSSVGKRRARTASMDEVAMLEVGMDLTPKKWENVVCVSTLQLKSAATGQKKFRAEGEQEDKTFAW